MRSTLKMTYTTDRSEPTGTLLGTNQEFVFGIDIGPGSTKNDALSFVQETKITQPGTLLAFVGDISDSTFSIPPPPGRWQTSNDILSCSRPLPQQHSRQSRRLDSEGRPLLFRHSPRRTALAERPSKWFPSHGGAEVYRSDRQREG
jgi:hypothetical protein